MIWQRVRVALLASMVALAAALPVAPSGKAHAGDCAPCNPGNPCASAMKTVKVYVTVPEYYTTTRTVYKTQKCEEKYTAYRCEKVPETRTRKVCVYEKVPCEETKTRCVCVNVPCYEEKTCMQKRWVTKTITTYKKKCVDQGHYECKEVECKPGILDRLSSKKGCGNGCGDVCCPPCPKMKTVRVWVPCKVWIEEPVCKTIRVCECVPVTKRVCKYKKEVRQETYKVCHWKCVPKEKEETYTVCVEKKVPFEATRIVCKCVPVQEQVKCCRMVRKCIEKQVPCEPACSKRLFNFGGLGLGGIIHNGRKCCD